MEKLFPYDPAEDLITDETIAFFIAEAFAVNDTGFIVHALGTAARAKGMEQLAKQAGLPRAELQRLFSETTNSALRSSLAVLKALGIELSVRTSRF